MGQFPVFLVEDNELLKLQLTVEETKKKNIQQWFIPIIL